jgi:DNA mismatch repair protein MutS2
MNEHALGVLEFRRVRELVAERAATSVGASRVRALEPRHDAEWLEQEQSRVSAVRSLIQSEGGWRSEAIPEVGEALNRLRVAGATLQALELFAIGRLLTASRLTKAGMSRRWPWPFFANFAISSLSTLVRSRPSTR